MNIHTRLRKSSLLLALLVSAGTHHAIADTLVKLDATQLPPGPLETWVNSGTIASNFTSSGAQIPVVANIAGVNAVQFIGTGGGANGTHYVGPVPPSSVTGTNGRTVEAWVWDPAAQGEKVIFGWGRRGADNINCSFNHGTDAAFGAVGHWGGGPDIGWAGQITFSNWTHIVYTYDPFTFVKSVYKDGQLANRETNSLNGNNGPPFVPLNTAAINDAGTTPLRFRVARQNNGSGTPSGTGVGTNYIARIRVHDVRLHPSTVLATYYRELCDFAPLGVSCVDDDADGFPNWYESLFPGCLDPSVPNPPGNDCDNDGATDLEEYQNRSLVNNPDTDGDGVSDGAEIHRAAGATDPANPDSDGDGLSDLTETGTGVYVSASDTGTNPLSRDSDGDTLSDPYELSYLGCLDANVNDGAGDCDNDGLSNLAEFQNLTFPNDPDSDNDTLTDGAEVNRQDGGSPAPTDPLRADTDADGLSDPVETDTGIFVSAIDTGTDPRLTDSDGDTYTDGVEVRRNSSPTDNASLPDLTTPLINLDATTLALGPLGVWQNTGLLPGNFNAGGTTPQVRQVQNINGVTLDGANNTGGHYTGPGAPEWICGTNGRTVEAWIFNPAAADEETIFSWARRGGPGNRNMSFNHGLNAVFGAVGHWDPGPDIGYGSPTNVAQGRWTYVAYTYNPLTLVKTVYTDGRVANVETNSLNAANGPPFAPLNTWAVNSAGLPLPFRVGAQNEPTGAPTGPLRASLSVARIRVYEVALSQAALDSKFAVEAEEFGQDDRDGDGLPTWFERLYAFLDPTNPADGPLDEDGDGLTNLEEYQSNTLPDDADSDDDGATDTAEVRRLDNGVPAPTNPRRPDTDQDGLLDSVETDTGVFVSAADTGSDPLIVDSDGDRFADGQEIIHESNPNDQFNTPDFDFTDPVAVINLDATGLTPGALASWPNAGAIGGAFQGSPDPSGPQVAAVANVKGVTLSGINNYYTGPITPLYMAGTNSRTVEAWVYNPQVADEETIFAWGRRGGPDGVNCSFNHGMNATFGAVGHWGTADIGWNGNVTGGQWTFVAYTFNNADATVSVYRDGQLANSGLRTNINTFAVDTLGNALPFRLGAQNEANGSVTPGLMGSMTVARLRVYDEALTPDDISARYTAEAAYFFRCPTAQSQSLATHQRTPLAITLNATDPQNDPLTYRIVRPPAGTLTPDGSGPNLIYTPSPENCTGTDSFTFVADDGNNDPQCDSALGTVTIAITCNNCPVAGSQAVTAEGPAVISLSYSDPDGDPLTVSISSPPAHGTYDMNTSTYTPVSGYGGPDSFTFTVNDGLCSVSGTVSITVIRNGPPVCVARLTPSECGVTFTSGGKVYAIAVKRDYVCLTLDGSGTTDPDGDPISISWVIDGTNLVSGAVVTNCLDVGCHTITMIADDGIARCHQFLDVCVIEPSEAIEQCIALVESTPLERKNKRPLLVSLKAAKAAFDRQGWRVGKLMLLVFEFKVIAQISRHNPAEAASFIQCAENIIKAIECVVKHTPRKGDDDGDDDDDRTRDDDDNGGPRDGDDDD